MLDAGCCCQFLELDTFFLKWSIFCTAVKIYNKVNDNRVVELQSYRASLDVTKADWLICLCIWWSIHFFPCPFKTARNLWPFDWLIEGCDGSKGSSPPGSELFHDVNNLPFQKLLPNNFLLFPVQHQMTLSIDHH